MARTPVPSKVIRGFQYVLENDFTGGLKTEFTGLNFPENACTSTENCTFFHTGAVFRRNGFDYEANATTVTSDRTNKAVSSFIWNNVGGDGSTKIFVTQVGKNIGFYVMTNATIASPLSTTLLSSSIDISAFVPVGSGNTVDSTACQYSAGNGYLFIFHPFTDPIYCTYSAGVVTANSITLQQRDFVGTPEPGVADTVRPPIPSITNQHIYNLQNQGWTSAPAWAAATTDTLALSANGSILQVPVGVFSVTHVSSTITGVSVGQGVTLSYNVFASNGVLLGTLTAQGVVNVYSGTTLTLSITSSTNMPWTIAWPTAGVLSSSTVTPSNGVGQLNTWVVGPPSLGNYPSNSDVWWQFKNSSGVFSPSTTLNNISLGSGPAPKGFFILNSFNQQRSAISAVSGISDITTFKRPKTGTWFAGRVFYAGVDDGTVIAATSNSWSENIYFSQIVAKTEQFARCYQTNDPTDENLFDVLPSDGGVITIQGSGSIYKLFPITNGLLVFAANGIWFITGSTGIGFTATDYTISKVSAIQSISSTSYVDVLGYPMFWNEEGIYTVGMDPGQQGLTVNSLTLNSIKQFYDAIPLQSKKFARGSYNPITGQVQWLYRSTNETDVTSRYQFDSILNFSMFTQAFYPWQLSTGNVYIHDVSYVVNPGGSTAPASAFKYFTSAFQSPGVYKFTFAEERDNTNWKDWVTAGFTTDYSSFFLTGYRLHGDAQRKWQPGYVYMYLDNTLGNSAYAINGRWNYANSGSSGKFSTTQTVFNNINTTNFGKFHRRHKIRGSGTVLQLQIASVSGRPFRIEGWSIWETQNSSV